MTGLASLYTLSVLSVIRFYCLEYHPQLIFNFNQGNSTAKNNNLINDSKHHYYIGCVINDSGDSPVADVAEAHTELFESVIEVDDELMERLKNKIKT